jgi:hypothetical protein
MTRFGDLAGEWLDNRLNLRRTSLARDESYLRNHVLPVFEDPRIFLSGGWSAGRSRRG